MKTLVKEATIKWIKEIHNHSQVGLPSIEVIEDLRQFQPAGPLMVYRGLSFQDAEDFKQKTKLEKFPQRLGEKVRYPLGIHWTRKIEIAENFAEAGLYSLVVSAYVEPEEVLFDFASLPQDLVASLALEWADEDEVILLTSPEFCVVEHSRHLLDSE